MVFWEDFKALKEAIIKCFLPVKPKKIYLFGSFARGEADVYSDIDLIIVYETKKRFLKRLEELYLLWDLPKAVDILAYTPEEFERLKKEGGFVAQAIKEGKLIYEANI